VPQLTYKGFLKRYVREISGLSTNNIDTLAYVACKELPRLRYPLYAYAKEHGKLDKLNRVLSQLNYELSTLTENEAWEKAKLMDVYNYHKNKRENESRVKGLVHSKIIHLQTEKGISNYRISKDLGLNSGNVNVFIKNGNKLALITVEQIFEYLKKY